MWNGLPIRWMHFTVQHAWDVPGKGAYIVFVTLTDVNTELVKFVFLSSTANGSRVWRALSQGLFKHRFPLYDCEWEMWRCSQKPPGCWEGEGHWPGGCSVMFMLMRMNACRFQNVVKLQVYTMQEEICGCSHVIFNITTFKMNI